MLWNSIYIGWWKCGQQWQNKRSFVLLLLEARICHKASELDHGYSSILWHCQWNGWLIIFVCHNQYSISVGKSPKVGGILKTRGLPQGDSQSLALHFGMSHTLRLYLSQSKRQMLSWMKSRTVLLAKFLLVLPLIAGACHNTDSNPPKNLSILSSS